MDTDRSGSTMLTGWRRRWNRLRTREIEQWKEIPSRIGLKLVLQLLILTLGGYFLLSSNLYFTRDVPDLRMFRIIVGSALLGAYVFVVTLLLMVFLLANALSLTPARWGSALSRLAKHIGWGGAAGFVIGISTTVASYVQASLTQSSRILDPVQTVVSYSLAGTLLFSLASLVLQVADCGRLYPTPAVAVILLGAMIVLTALAAAEVSFTPDGIQHSLLVRHEIDIFRLVEMEAGRSPTPDEMDLFFDQANRVTWPTLPTAGFTAAAVVTVGWARCWPIERSRFAMKDDKLVSQER